MKTLVLAFILFSATSGAFGQADKHSLGSYSGNDEEPFRELRAEMQIDPNKNVSGNVVTVTYRASRLNCDAAAP